MSRIQTFQLSGHKGPVTCLANNSHLNTITTTSNSTSTTQNTKSPSNDSSFISQPVLLSGSEDGTVRLWDLKANCKRAALCITCPCQDPNNTVLEVTAVSLQSFPSPNAWDKNLKDETNNLHLSYPFTIFASWAGKVYAYDIRNTSTPIVSYHEDDTCKDSAFYSIPQIQGEEINQIALYYDHRLNVQYLATADDDGWCRILHPIPLANHPTDNVNAPSFQSQCIPHATNNNNDAALVTSIAFRPKTKPNQVELVTSGTDCTICLWDLLNGKKKVNAKLKSRFYISKLISDENANQVCNPPLVHSTCWSPSGRFLSAGLGDGSILILRPEGRRLVEVSRIASTHSRIGHSSAVASVLFPQFGNIQHSTSHVTTEDRFMVTGGNDGNIIFWDLGSFVGRDYAMDPRSYIQCCDEKDTNRPKGSNATTSSSLDDDMEQLSLATSSLDPNVLFALNHKEKPNCLLSTHASDAVFANSVIVGDTSNDITIYTLPRI